MSGAGRRPPERRRSAAAERARRWRERVERSPHGLWMMGVFSYLESTVLPIPMELVLIAYLVARRDRVWTVAAVVTGGFLLGALTGYAIGYLLFESVGAALVEAQGWGEATDRFRSLVGRYGFWAIVAVGVLPVPFQAAMLVAGAAAYPIALFVLAAALARGLRYFGLAALVRFAGTRARTLWERHAVAVTIAVGVGCAIVWALSAWSG